MILYRAAQVFGLTSRVRSHSKKNQYEQAYGQRKRGKERPTPPLQCPIPRPKKINCRQAEARNPLPTQQAPPNKISEPQCFGLLLQRRSIPYQQQNRRQEQNLIVRRGLRHQQHRQGEQKRDCISELRPAFPLVPPPPEHRSTSER